MNNQANGESRYVFRHPGKGSSVAKVSEMYEPLLNEEGSATTSRGTASMVQIDFVQKLREVRPKSLDAFERELSEKFRRIGRPQLPSRVGLGGEAVTETGRRLSAVAS